MQKTINVKHYLAASIALVTFLVYLPALRNEFVYWDDNQYIFENPYIRSLDATFFRWAFTTTRMGNWNPLTWISHAVDYAVWGLNPLGHHLTNVLLHAANTALVVLLALKLLEIVQGSVRNASSPLLNDRTVLMAAGVTGLLFGIHPIHAESVAWAAERKDLLCALFFLLSLIAYMKYAGSRGAGAVSQKPEGGKDDEAGGKNFFANKHYLLALWFFVLALMSKPMAVSLPAVLLILDWYPLGRIRNRKTFWSAGTEKLLFIVLSLVSAVVAVFAQGASKAYQAMDFVPLHVRVLVAIKSLAAYLGKMLLPINLIHFYPYPKEVSFFSFEYLLALALVIGITAAAVIAVKRQRAWLTAWGFYVLTLMPVLGVVQVGGQAMADRYTYLPSLGPFIIAGACTAWLAEKTRGTIIGKAGIAAALLFVVSLSYLTVRQISVWHDSFSLWTSVIERGTEKIPMAYVNRGAAFQKTGQLDKAVADYEKAIALDPSDSRAYISLGAVLDKMGQIERAKEAVTRAIALDPSSPEAFRNRGLLLEKMGRLEEAIADYSRAIALQPSYYEAYNNRGLTYARKGQFDKAVADYNESISINPRYFNAYLNRGVALTLTGQYDGALEDFNKAIILGQDDAVAYYNRGMFYRRAGKNELALPDIRKACELENERACGALQQLMQGMNP